MCYAHVTEATFIGSCDETMTSILAIVCFYVHFVCSNAIIYGLIISFMFFQMMLCLAASQSMHLLPRTTLKKLQGSLLKLTQSSERRQRMQIHPIMHPTPHPRKVLHQGGRNGKMMGRIHQLHLLIRRKQLQAMDQ